MFVCLTSYAVGLIYTPGKLGSISVITVQCYDVRKKIKYIMARGSYYCVRTLHYFYIILMQIYRMILTFWIIIRYILSSVLLIVCRVIYGAVYNPLTYFSYDFLSLSKRNYEQPFVIA